jgi:hypothetical protein
MRNETSNVENHQFMQAGAVFQSVSALFGAPGMGDNLVVKVHYALGSRKRYPKARVSVARRNPEEAGC